MGSLSDRFDWSLGQSLSLLRGNILVMTLTGVLGAFARAMAFPYLSLYVLGLGGDPSRIGMINTLAPLAGLVMFPLGGYLADRMHRVRMIGISGLISGIFLLCYVVAPNWQMIALGAFLHGVMVIQFPATSALLADSLAPEDRGQGIGVMNGAMGILSLAAPYVAGALLDAVGVVRGMRYLYGFMTAAYILGALANWYFLEETTDGDDGLVWSDLLQVLKASYSGIPSLFRSLSPSLLALGGVACLTFLVNAVAGPFWVVYAGQHIGLSNSAWGLILLIETAVRNLLMLSSGVLVDRLGRTRCMAAALILALVTFPLFIFADSFVDAMGIRLCAALATALFLPASSALMADLTPSEKRGRVMSALGQGTVLLGVASGSTGGPALGYLIVPPLMAMSLASGYLYDLDPRAPWAFLTAALLAALVLTVLYIRDPEKAHA